MFIFLIDCGGRCFLFLIGGVGMCVSCFSMGFYFFVIINFVLDIDIVYGGFDILWVVVISIVVYIVGFVMVWGFCIWFIMSEIFFVKVKGVVSGIVIFFNWFCFFFVIFLFDVFIDGFIIVGMFWFFGSFVFFVVFFVYFYVLEMKGKLFEEI